MMKRVLVFVVLLWNWPLTAATPKQLAVIQGATSDTATQIAVLAPREENIVIAVTDRKKKHLEPTWLQSTEGFGQNQMIHTIQLEQLSPDSRYEITIKREKSTQTHAFGTLNTKSPKARIAIASCMDDSYTAEQEGMWTGLLKQKPDAVFLIGDNVYADRRGAEKLLNMTPAILWERYAETRNRLAIFHAKELTPIFAVWDDHDYGDNDGDGSHSWKYTAGRIMGTFFPREALQGVYEPGPGTARELLAFGQRFLFLDDRFFRTEKGKTPEAHFGKFQEDWVMEKLKSDEKPTWLISGDQFFGAYQRFESYEGTHPKAFKEFLARLKAEKDPIFFVSGDRHLAELMKISKKDVGQETFELTTSGIHAKMYPSTWKEAPNRRQLAGAANVLNYAVIDIQKIKPLKLKVQVMGPKHEPLFERELTISGQK